MIRIRAPSAIASSTSRRAADVTSGSNGSRAVTDREERGLQDRQVSTVSTVDGQTTPPSRASDSSAGAEQAGVDGERFGAVRAERIILARGPAGGNRRCPRIRRATGRGRSARYQPGSRGCRDRRRPV